jgi:hypothetical protein
MSLILRRLLKLLFILGIYDKHYVLTYDGEISSANKIWSGGHWSQRSAMKTKYHKIFEILLLQAKVKPLKEMSIVTLFNSRHDVDNLFSLSKCLADTIKGKYILEDNNKLYKMTLTAHDDKLPKGVVEFHIIGK